MATVELPYIPTFTPHQIIIQQRRYRAWQMRQEGMTLVQIGAALGVSMETACRDIKRFERQQQTQTKRSA